jgi:hypothetical protein
MRLTESKINPPVRKICRFTISGVLFFIKKDGIKASNGERKDTYITM